MKSTSFALTDVGLKRPQNEDAFYADDEVGLYIICDGMGGHSAGEIAAKIAIEGIARGVKEQWHEVERLRSDSTSDSDIIAFIESIIRSTCLEVHTEAQSRFEYAQMGTTLTMVLKLENRAVLGHVGDSRLYLLRDDQIYQLSDDHTFSNDYVRLGVLSPEAAKTHRFRHVLTRSIGLKPTVQVDTLLFDLLPRDILMLCSDGLSEHFDSVEDLGELIDSTDLEAVVRNLVDFAKDRGGADNITVIGVSLSADHKEDEEEEHATAVQELTLAIRRMPVFETLLLRELLQVMSVAEVQDASAGETVVLQGATCNHYSYVVSGELFESRTSGISRKLRAGDSFGWECFLEAATASATIEAKTDCRLFRIAREHLDKLLRRRPRLGQKVYRRLAQELSRLLHSVVTD